MNYHFCIREAKNSRLNSLNSDKKLGWQKLPEDYRGTDEYSKMDAIEMHLRDQ